MLAKGYSPQLPPLCAIGYRQLCNHVTEKDDLSGAELEKELAGVINDIGRETRRFAKRQMTWFRKLVGVWLEPTEVARAVELARKFLQ